VSDPSLFFLALGKTLLMTGVGPGIILMCAVARCPYPFCVKKEFHEDGHDVRVPIEQFEPDDFSTFRGSRS
jgi:hypothetical protein